MTPLPQPDLNYLQRVLLEMLAIPSPTGFTDTIVRYVAEQLDELGVPFEMTRRGTIRATLQGRLNTPDRAVSAHLDTIGALVREIKPNGRLGLAPVGCWSSRFAEGSRVTVFTEQGVFRGSVLPLLASGHAFNTEVDNLKISWDNIELRLDAYTASRADSESLGISVGDYVAFDPLPEFTESGHISARHLDDKAGVAALLAALKAVKESGQEPPIDCHPLFTITEEVGSGAAGALPWDVSEFVGIDIAPVAEGQNSNEHSVSVAMQDSGGPYDFHLSRHLLRLGERHDIALRRDLFRYYHSDAQSAIAAGHDTRAALPAFAGLALAEGSLRPPLSGGFLFGLAWLVLLPTFGGYGLYWLGLRHLSAQGGSAALYLSPALTLLWAHWMFAEPLTPMLLGGLLLSLAGLGWLYRAERR